MRIAFTHNNADCDGFASLVGLRALYPGLRIVLGQRVAPRVKRLLALHREFVRPMPREDVDLAALELAVVADVRRRGRLAEYEEVFRYREAHGSPRLIVFDHHSAAEDDLDADETYLAQVGATCTLVTEHLRKAGVSPSVVESTLLCIGIHTDTGSLTFATSTARDAGALNWLMEQGANTRMVERFLRQTLTEAQRTALTLLLQSIRVIEVGGLTVAVAGVALDRGVDGLASVVAQALRLTEFSAVFGVFHIRGRKAQIVARARAPEIDAGAVLRVFGGGGHRAAAAATLRIEDPFALLDAVTETILSNAPESLLTSALTDKEIPTIEASASFQDAVEQMEKLGVGVLAVTRDGQLAGSVDRGFVQSAQRDGRMQNTIGSAMRHGLQCVSADLAIDQLTERLIESDQPALFVERGGEVIGWVLRRRVLDTLYHVDEAPTWAG